MSIVHGGNVYEVASRLRCAPETILDFSASINPLGPPPGLLEEIGRQFHLLQHYPDIRNESLTGALARFHGVGPDQIVVGNGSTELIYCLPRALGIKKAVMVLPTFSEYQKAFELQGVLLGKLITRVEDRFQPTVEQLESICAAFSPEAVMVTNPGSPSGTVLPSQVRDWLLNRCLKQKTLCIVDEVFVDFCEDESFKGYIRDVPNLVLIRSMTKFYGIPGLRLGYVMASEDAARRMRESLPPWTVNTLAQVAGKYCLEQEEYKRKTLELVGDERDRLCDAVEGLHGCRVLPGMANYLLVELGETLPPAPILCSDVLSSSRILVRDCTSFDGVGERFIRLAVRLPEENRRVLEAIGQWMESHAGR